ncbi:hypothetical protein GDO86_007372 [Hymenochirus boettgeri]|uniref:Centromere protein P n=1 Tax=Hymenochirus boettgeri TaxID=247094 RepID=A0A8T2IXG8_9PIPI|nr:hypothetical protein GDO86_007372 [Hymenochirus boettgeri]
MIMQGDANQACEDEILLLQEEIQELTQKFKKNQAEIASLSSANIKKAMQSCHEILIPNHERITDTTSIIAQIGENEEELQFLNSLSGIVFTQYSKKVKHRNNQVMNKHRLVGNCQFLSFQMEFQIMDNKTKEDTCRFIDDLNIIMECREQSDLSKFVSRVEERRNLLLFFRTLSKFAEWSEYRKNTFVQFKVGQQFVYLLLLIWIVE